MMSPVPILLLFLQFFFFFCQQGKRNAEKQKLGKDKKNGN